MIKPFSSDDTEAVLDIWHQASALAHSFLTPEFIAQEDRNLRDIYLKHAEVWIAAPNDVTTGFIALIKDEIGGLFLRPSAHGRGLGRAMVDHTVMRKGPLRVEVFEKNSIGRRFYATYGFVETGRVQHQPAGEVLLQLAFTPP